MDLQHIICFAVLSLQTSPFMHFTVKMKRKRPSHDLLQTKLQFPSRAPPSSVTSTANHASTASHLTTLAIKETSHSVDADLTEDTFHEFHNTGRRDAFSVLMASKNRQPTPKYHFHAHRSVGTDTTGLRQHTWTWGLSRVTGSFPLSASGTYAYQTHVRLKIPVPDLLRDGERSIATEIFVTLQDDASIVSEPYPATRSSTLPVSLLKSALQKAVRRGRTDAAVKIAQELWIADPQEAVRRIMVIIVEDSTLHPAYPLLAWLLCVLPAGFVPDLHCMHLYLSIARQMCSCAFVDDFRFVEGSCVNDKLAKGGITVLDEEPVVAPWALSLLLRAAYGGMAFDVGMLQRAAEAWMIRGLSSLPQWQQALQCMHSVSGAANQYVVGEPIAVSRFSAADVPLVAIDYHCSGILDHFMDLYKSADAEVTSIARSLSAAGDALVDMLRSAMWKYRSGVNVRQRLPLDPGVIITMTPTLLSEEVAVSQALSTAENAALAAVWPRLTRIFDAYALRIITRYFK